MARQLSRSCDKLLSQTLCDKRPPKKAQRLFVSALRGFAFAVMQYPSDYNHAQERDALTDVLAAYLENLDTNRSRTT